MLAGLMVRRLLAASLVFNGGRGNRQGKHLFFLFFLSPALLSRFCHVASHVDWSRVARGVSESNVTEACTARFFIEGDARLVYVTCTGSW